MTFSSHTVGSAHHITDAEGNTVAIIPDGPAQKRDFVVTALNNHDALVNVLRDLTRSIGSAVDSVEKTRSKYQQAIELLATL